VLTHGRAPLLDGQRSAGVASGVGEGGGSETANLMRDLGSVYDSDPSLQGRPLTSAILHRRPHHGRKGHGYLHSISVSSNKRFSVWNSAASVRMENSVLSIRREDYDKGVRVLTGHTPNDIV
jgi:hypothetical protein